MALQLPNWHKMTGEKAGLSVDDAAFLIGGHLSPTGCVKISITHGDWFESQKSGLNPVI